MSETWINFKRAFGAVARREQKATTLVREMAVQRDVSTKLGRDDDARRMTDERVWATSVLAGAKLLGNTAEGYRLLGVAKDHARAVLRAPVEADAVARTLRAVDGLLKNLDDKIDQDKQPQRFRRLEALKKSRKELKPEISSKQAVFAFEKSAIKLLDDVLWDEKVTRKLALWPNETEKQDMESSRSSVFSDMLAARYGFDPKNVKGQVGLDKFYEALALIPASHVCHDSLKSVEIVESKEDWAGGYAGTTIRINAARARSKPTMEYQMDGTRKKLDAFKVATLHEVGHAIDDKAKVMTHPDAPSFGGWKEETLGSVATACWGTFKDHFSSQNQDEICRHIEKVLQGGNPTPPTFVVRWSREEALAALETCAAMAADEAPWKTIRAFGDRCYTRNGQHKWLSYAKAQRDALTVRDYQWRAPAEWFAELYAASWMFKKPPPPSVDAAAAIFMYRGT